MAWTWSDPKRSGAKAGISWRVASPRRRRTRHIDYWAPSSKSLPGTQVRSGSIPVSLTVATTRHAAGAASQNGVENVQQDPAITTSTRSRPSTNTVGEPVAASSTRSPPAGLLPGRQTWRIGTKSHQLTGRDLRNNAGPFASASSTSDRSTTDLPVPGNPPICTKRCCVIASRAPWTNRSLGMRTPPMSFPISATAWRASAEIWESAARRDGAPLRRKAPFSLATSVVLSNAAACPSDTRTNASRRRHKIIRSSAVSRVEVIRKAGDCLCFCHRSFVQHLEPHQHEVRKQAMGSCIELRSGSLLERIFRTSSK